MKDSAANREKNSGLQTHLMRVILWSVSVLFIVCGAVLKVNHQPYGQELLVTGVVGLELLFIIGLGMVLLEKKEIKFEVIKAAFDERE